MTSPSDDSTISTDIQQHISTNEQGLGAEHRTAHTKISKPSNSDHDFTLSSTSLDASPSLPKPRPEKRSACEMSLANRRRRPGIEERQLLGGQSRSTKAIPIGTSLPDAKPIKKPGQPSVGPRNNLYGNNNARSEISTGYPRSPRSLHKPSVQEYRQGKSSIGDAYDVDGSSDCSRSPPLKRRKTSRVSESVPLDTVILIDDPRSHSTVIDVEDETPRVPSVLEATDNMGETDGNRDSDVEILLEPESTFRKPRQIPALQNDRFKRKGSPKKPTGLGFNERSARLSSPIPLSDDEKNPLPNRYKENPIENLAGYLDDMDRSPTNEATRDSLARESMVNNKLKTSSRNLGIIKPKNKLKKRRPIPFEMLAVDQDDDQNETSIDELQVEDNSKFIGSISKNPKRDDNTNLRDLRSDTPPSIRDRADIPRSVFTGSSMPRKAHLQTSTKRPNHRAWGISYVHTPNRKVDGSEMKISYSTDNDNFIVEPPHPESLGFQINPRKITNVVMAKAPGLEIRLEGGRINGKNQIWDFQFCSREGLEQFLEAFQSCFVSPVTLREHDSGLMERRFRRREEEEDRLRARNPSISYEENMVRSMPGSSGQSLVLESSELEQRPRRGSRLIERIQGTPIANPQNSKGVSNTLRHSLDPGPSRLLGEFRSKRQSARVASRSSLQDQRRMSVQEELDPVTEAALFESFRESLGGTWQHPLVYPKQGVRRATVEFEDLFRLKDGEFLNDNVIMFYLRYLEEEAIRKGTVAPKSIHFFNSYFYDTLTKTERGQRGIKYNLVKRWVKDDIFKYDYAVVPINEDAHWYVAILCNLSKIGSPSTFPEEKQYDPEIKVIDERSLIPGEDVVPSSSNLEDLTLSDVQSNTRRVNELSLEDQPENISDPGEILVEEKENNDWPDDNENEREPTTSPFRASTQSTALQDRTTLTGLLESNKIQARRNAKRRPPPTRKYNVDTPVIIILDSLDQPHPKTRSNLKAYLTEEGKAKLDIDVTVEQAVTAKGIPLQPNYYDCGVYLLAYMDKFLADPKNFVSRILTREMDLATDWPAMNVTEMRITIKDLLLDLHKAQEAARTPKKKKKKDISTLPVPISPHPDKDISGKAEISPTLKSNEDSENRKEERRAKVMLVPEIPIRKPSDEKVLAKNTDTTDAVPSVVSPYFRTTKATMPPTEPRENSENKSILISPNKKERSSSPLNKKVVLVPPTPSGIVKEDSIVGVHDSQSPSKHPITGPSLEGLIKQLEDSAQR